MNPLDFSVILGCVPPERSKVFRLRRYNGFHYHTNKLEKDFFRGFHIHYATERYQSVGLDEEGYAEQTNRYATLDEAMEVFLNDCNFSRPDEERQQPRLL